MKIVYLTVFAAVSFLSACDQPDEPPVVYGTAVYDKYGGLIGFENEAGVVVPTSNGVVLPDGTVAPAVPPAPLAPVAPAAPVQTQIQAQVQTQTTTTVRTQVRGGP